MPRVPHKGIMSDIDRYLDAADPRAIRFDGLDEAVVGVDHTGCLVYHYDTMHQIFMSEDAMTDEEATEWIDFNVIGTNAGVGFTILFEY